MSDDHREDPKEQTTPPAAGDPAIPAGTTGDVNTPPVTPSHDGGAAVPPPPPSTGKPADYYAQPPVGTPESKKGCGKWLVGCSIGGCLVGILIIVGFVWMARSGWPMLMSRMMTEVESHVETFGDDVDPAVKEELEIELRELKRHIEEGDVSLEDMQGVIYSMRDVVGDEDVTTEEVEEFLEDVRDVNREGASAEF